MSTGRRQPRPGADVVLDRFLEPDGDVEQAAAAAGRGVAALEGELRVRRGEQGDVLDRVLDVEVFEGRDVEVRRVEVGLHEPGQDRATTGIDDADTRRGRSGLHRREFGHLLGLDSLALHHADARVCALDEHHVHALAEVHRLHLGVLQMGNHRVADRAVGEKRHNDGSYSQVHPRRALVVSC